MRETTTDPTELPYETIPELITYAVEQWGDSSFVQYEDTTYTYREIDERSERVAAALSESGVEPGDPVCTLLYNSVEYLSIWFAVAKLGAILVPLNVELEGEGLSYILNDSKADIILLEEETRDRYEAVCGDLDTISTEFFIGEPETDEYRAFSELQQGDSAAVPDTTVSLKDTMSIIYTSGTTGLPKGVELPHFSYLNTGLEFATHLGLTQDDTTFTTLPLFHCNPQQLTVMGALQTGGDVAIERWFSASNYVERLRETGATHFVAIGTMLRALAKQPPSDSDRTHSVEYGIAAPVPEDLYETFSERFDVQLFEAYGLTETATIAAMNEPDTPRHGSFGRPVRHAELNVVDEHDRPVENGEVGEIVVRPTEPYTMMKKYYNRPDATVDAWENLWFHTGDMGYRDDDGYYYFVERKAYTIRHRGENISATEVESILETCPHILECAIVGVPGELGEEDVKAYIKRDPESELSYSDVGDWCDGRLAAFKQPRYIEFVEGFPKTATERIEKHKLKERGVGDAWDKHTTL